MIFREHLLDGRRIAFAGDGGCAIVESLRGLGAWVGEAPAGEDELVAWVAERTPLHALVADVRPEFGPGADDALQRTLERAWTAARALATGALIRDRASGRLLFVAPRPEAGSDAPAARAALENLARTLSVEWARFAVTAVAIWPGPDTTDAQLAELVCFLVSDAGGYFSGCRLELGAADSGH